MSHHQTMTDCMTMADMNESRTATDDDIIMTEEDGALVVLPVLVGTTGASETGAPVVVGTTGGVLAGASVVGMVALGVSIRAGGSV